MTASDSSVPGRGQSGHGDGGDSSLPRFDVVVRGYDRRQVDEYVSDLEETIARQRVDLEQARGSGAAGRSTAAPLFESGGRPGTESTGGLTPEMIGAFTTRLQSILQAAEEEADEVRTNARNFARKEEEASRARLNDLEHRRDGVLDSLTQVRGQLDSVLAEARDKAGDGPVTPAKGTPQGSGRPESGQRPDAPRPDSRQGSLPVHEGNRPSPAPRPDSSSDRPGDRHGDALPVRPRPNPGPGAPSPSVTPSPGTGPKSPSPAPQTGSGPGGLPTRQPGGTPSPHPKPRPTPSPRPRAGQAAAAPVHGPQEPGRGSAEHPRNGVINRANGAPGRGDDPDGGRSAFGSGAR